METTAGTPAPTGIGKIRRAGAIGNFIEYFDNALYGFFAVTIAKLFFPAFDPVVGLLSTFALFGVSFVVRPLGAIVFGHIGDRWGRKTVLISSILLMSIATALVGVLPTYSAAGVLAPVLLLFCRLCQGFSTGGESTTALVLVAEHSPVPDRGRNVAPLISATIAASVAASLTAMIVSLAVPASALSGGFWRVPFLIAIPLGVVGLVLRLQVDDAEVYKSAAEVSTVIGKKHTPLAQAFRTAKKGMLVLFLWVALQATAGYITVSYMATHLMHFDGHSTISTYAIIAAGLAVATAAMPLLGRLTARMSRKTFAMAMAAGLVIFSYPAFLLLGQGAVVATIGLAAFAVLQFGTMISSGLAVVELFPVDVRASASALPYALGFAAFGGTAPFISTWLAAEFSPTAPAFYVIVLAVIGFFVGWLGLPNAREMAVLADGGTDVGTGQETGAERRMPA
ncbi:MHS family MFS transporter [Amycolatopsis acidicola]|uniref:MHS family MFS transporter n=1 Tax=Amycolatopsis acidicola TaxID=2596893 RepID=A0A5N0VGB6_9PSEU|nr:MFS transporter [Amycolatopsis acidicola]KAA9164433.1 MHS family MFS transporter [Amycolatopsis acidicola]